jgi:hypothetical protein
MTAGHRQTAEQPSRRHGRGSLSALCQIDRPIEPLAPGALAGPFGVAGLAEAMVVHGALTESVPEMQAIIDKDAFERLY